MTDRRPVVFVGPSLDGARAASVIDAVIMPPARLGDVAEAAREADVIVLIDGVMVYDFPPTPTEIAGVLASGVRVYGAASLGALRATELAQAGMIGCGWVFEQYRSGAVIADDELVVRLGPDVTATTHALISIRYAAAQLVDQGRIHPQAARDLLAALGRIYFEDRTSGNLLAAISASGLGVFGDELLAGDDVKAQDALQCLALVARRHGARRTSDGRRSIEDVDSELRARLSEFGITRMAETTGLDRVGIPTYSFVKPRTSDVIWVYSGKGETHEAARVSGIMECVERTAALWDVSRVRRATIAQAELEGAICPDRFTEARASIEENADVLWVEGSDLAQGCAALVPADLAFSGRRPELDVPSAFRLGTSNGLGAGLTLDAARAQAIREVIERHVVSLAQLGASHYATCYLAAIAERLGVEGGAWHHSLVDDPSVATSVKVSSIPEDLATLLNMFRSAGLSVSLKYIPNEFDLPVFVAAAAERIAFDSILACAGYGASTCPRRAIRSALLELAQTRATDRQGAREDRLEPEKQRYSGTSVNSWQVAASDEFIDYHDVPSPDADPDDVSFYISAFKSLGMANVVAVDFARYPGIYVSRVLVPGAETWHATGGMSSLGTRARALFGVAA